MKALITGIILCAVAGCLWMYAAQTPNQLMTGAAAFQGMSERDLRVANTFLLSQMALVGATPTIILSNAAAFQSMSDRELQIAQLYLLNNLSGGFLVKSNTLASIPALTPGDSYYWSSNGVAYVITDSPSGVLVTNKLGP